MEYLKYVSGLVLALFFVVLGPTFAFAQSPGPAGTPDEGLVPCGNVKENNAVGPASACRFEDLITLAQTVINFLIFKVAAPLAAVMFIWAGFLYLTAAGNEGQVKKAHDLFWAVFIGLVIALAAWLMVSFILRFFLGDTSDYNFLG